ncbi:MAG: 16S rRNA (uracil(1498)-N(3))-methyltransferase [Kaiparowitsia implicata GSE-PSE-MK54-09C]|jgi:16S rRNA (uracil1498-N3)-methyltransferase|nr:16S rRNA (uracil(1498)-N(3))-methyltransferase [Kaiparowitsia implicata GSE-PSE-MK54-09C]
MAFSQRSLQRIAIAPDQPITPQLHLNSAQHHYLTRVLRLTAGDRFIALGHDGQCWVMALTADRAIAMVVEAIALPPPPTLSLTLLVAMPKGSGMDDIVRQTTELGVTTLVPVVSDRTLLHPSPQKLERWRRIAQEATEQSERAIIPEIWNPVPWAIALQQMQGTQGYICVARGDAPHLLTYLMQAGERVFEGRTVAIATGPEGGWTEAEIQQAETLGFQPASLGRTILRAVTAPVVATSVAIAALEVSPDLM